MENKKIKVLKDTPFHKKDDVLEINQFTEVYPCKNVSSSNLIEFLKIQKKDWFQIIEDKFKIGDWVWNELTKQTLYVVENKYGKEWYPNMCTINAVNENPEIYKRKATQEEIDHYTLESFCNETVLIGKYQRYYFHNVWKPLLEIEYNLRKYLQISKELGDIHTSDSIWKSKLNGLKVGCTEILHEDILKIAKILKLI